MAKVLRDTELLPHADKPLIHFVRLDDVLYAVIDRLVVPVGVVLAFMTVAFVHLT